MTSGIFHFTWPPSTLLCRQTYPLWTLKQTSEKPWPYASPVLCQTSALNWKTKVWCWEAQVLYPSHHWRSAFQARTDIFRYASFPFQKPTNGKHPQSNQKPHSYNIENVINWKVKKFLPSGELPPTLKIKGFNSGFIIVQTGSSLLIFTFPNSLS